MEKMPEEIIITVCQRWHDVYYAGGTDWKYKPGLNYIYIKIIIQQIGILGDK